MPFTVEHNTDSLLTDSHPSVAVSFGGDCSTPATYEHFSTSTEERSVFRDVDEVVDEASDTVCCAGLDIDSVAVENDDSQDAEERIACFISEGCRCQLNSGKPCSTLFSAANLTAARDECCQLT